MTLNIQPVNGKSERPITYHLFVNRVQKRVTLHASHCSHCQHGRGIHGNEDNDRTFWVGPFWAEGTAAAEQSMWARVERLKMSECKKCGLFRYVAGLA